MRLVEVRLLEGPNVYRLEPTVKIEVTIGRRRTWFGERSPGRHALVRLGRPVPSAAAPSSVRDLAAWVRRLHDLTGGAAWLAGSRVRRIPVTIHRTSEPGHWIVAYPWRERGRANAIAEHAFRLADRGADPRRASARRPTAASRTLPRALAAIRAAATTPPPWVTDDERRLPVVSISGTNGKSTTTRMLTHILVRAGRRVGTTTSDGVLIDEQLVEAGDLTGPAGARAVLERDDLDVGVLETARGGIVLKGVGYQSNDASIITNVSADHLDLHGLHTLPELAEVKSVIARMTPPEGVVVLNGEDDLVAGMARDVRAPVWLFSLDPRAPRVRRHVARGGRALVLDDGWLVEVDGGQRRPILAAADAPATLLGLARHNVANALAAAGGARALGATIEQVADGLRDFQPTLEHAPGRLNMYRIDERLVIVDFAHNEAGLSVVLDVAEGIAGRRDARRMPLSAIVGTAGDRPDDALRAVARIAAQRADHIALKETIRYLRGRTRESVLGELFAGLAEGGVRRRNIPVYQDEASALHAELTDEQRVSGQRGHPCVVILMSHADREGVSRVLDELGAVPLDHDALARIVAAVGDAPGAAAAGAPA